MGRAGRSSEKGPTGERVNGSEWMEPCLLGHCQVCCAWVIAVIVALAVVPARQVLVERDEAQLHPTAIVTGKSLEVLAIDNSHVASVVKAAWPLARESL